MSTITTHVLDAVLGKPAAGIPLTLETSINGKWTLIAQSVTGSDGRCRDLALDAIEGLYCLHFDTGIYFAQQKRKSIYPEIVIIFSCNSEDHYHLPLLLSDNSYTTYRGS